MDHPSSLSHEHDTLLSGRRHRISSYNAASVDAQHEPSRTRRKRSYTPHNHVQVLFQMYGSVLPQVLPFCISSVLWTLAIFGLKEKQVIDLTFKSTVGHSFMGLLISFLVVSRSRISYQRFMAMRQHLGDSYFACREFVQFACIYTMCTKTPEATLWRQEVAYRTIMLLRVTMDALNWSSMQREHWESAVPIDENNDIDQNEPSFRNKESDRVVQLLLEEYRHGNRTMIDLNLRAPIVLAYNLREVVMQHEQALGYKMPVNEYRDLLFFVSHFNKSFHGFRDFIFTPYPFPLAQMTRIFLFFWAYSLPLVLVEVMESIWDTVIIVFFVTFGFIGVEYVSMTLDDLFGVDDAVGFDTMGLAEMVYEDIYVAVMKVDGPESVSGLRSRILARHARGTALDNFREDWFAWWRQM